MLLWGDTGKRQEDAAALAKAALTRADRALASGWEDVRADAITVEDKSGGGGSQTFKISADGAEPPSVALHARNLEVHGELTEARTEAAATVLAAAGVAPARLAQGKDWFIEPWGGDQFAWGSPELADGLLARPPKCSTEGCNYFASDLKANVSLFGGYFCCLKCAGKNYGKPGEHDEAGFLQRCQKRPYSKSESPDSLPIEWAAHPHARWEALGALMARVHKVPPGWYEDFRAELCRRLPLIEAIPPASMYWWWGKQIAQASEWSEEGYRVWASEEYNRAFLPQTEPARRMVTCHGDFQWGNVLLSRTGELRVIDFETALAGCAAVDVAWTFGTWCTESTNEQKRFIQGCLAEAGFPFTGPDVDAFYVDVQIFSLTLPGAVASNAIPRSEGGPLTRGSSAVRKLCMEVARKYRACESFRAEVDASPASRGVVPWTPLRGLHSYIATHPEYTSNPEMQEIDAAIRGEAVESCKTFEGKRPAAPLC